MKIKKAIWGIDLDIQEDKLYRRPVCPVCKDPIGRLCREIGDNHYYCYSCRERVVISDPKMRRWLKVREQTKVTITTCLNCEQKTCVTKFYKDPINPRKWRVACGSCTSCGARFIV